MAHPQIAVFARLAKENSPTTRLLAGQKTYLSRTMHDVRYDPVNDEMLVTNPFARAILVFRGGADGEEAPVRIIQGSNTMLGDPKRYAGGPDRVEVNPVHNEIYVPDGSRVLVYDRRATGNVAPIRVLEGPDTLLDDEGTLAIDPINNIFAVAQDTVLAGATKMAHILTFARMAAGNTKPLGEIAGPKTEIIRINQLQMHPPKGWIIAAQPGFIDVQKPEGVFIGVWHIKDKGDVAPRFKIGGTAKGVMLKPRGVAINVKHKELLVADMRLNAILTYSVPELF
ncbi:MAG: hypothetical protein EXQ56_00745 [Acidobacteria bacterium]|nr:hypothetical protein [Acidobacteriota bacterium]